MLQLETAFILGLTMAVIIVALASLPYFLPQPGKIEKRKKGKK